MSSSIQHDAVAAAVKDGVSEINQIINVLDQPITGKSDIVDMDYSEDAIKSFMTHVAICKHDFETAAATAGAWFSSVGNQLQQTVASLGQVKNQINDTERQLAENQQKIDATAKAVADLNKAIPGEVIRAWFDGMNLQSAQNRLNDARAEQSRVRTARNALCWIPVVAVALTVVDLTKEENDVKSASTVLDADQHQSNEDFALLKRHQAELETQRQEAIALNAKMVTLHATEDQCNNQQADLTKQTETLTPLKVNIDLCIHTVSAALGGASNLDNMMSMKNLGEGIKGIVAALKNDSGLSSVLLNMNDQAFADLDRKIQALQKTSKKASHLGV